MAERETRVVGCFAYVTPMEVVCTDGDACLIMGSRSAMEQHLAGVSPSAAANATVKKTRFGEVLKGLELGAAYAFDKQSYGRFYPLALEAGLPVTAAEFDADPGSPRRFFTVRLRKK